MSSVEPTDSELAKLIGNQETTICELPFEVALAIFGTDIWFRCVPSDTVRVADWKANGNDIAVKTPRPVEGDGFPRFKASDALGFLDSRLPISRISLIQAIQKTPGLGLAFLFSVAKNKSVFESFCSLFKPLSPANQSVLLRSAAEIRGFFVHVAWILANCGGSNTLEAVSFDPVVKAVGTHHEFPSISVLIAIIQRIAETGSYGNLAEISEYAAGYVSVWHSRSETTAIYTDMDTTKFELFVKLVWTPGFHTTMSR